MYTVNQLGLQEFVEWSSTDAGPLFPVSPPASLGCSTCGRGCDTQSWHEVGGPGDSTLMQMVDEVVSAEPGLGSAA